MKTIIVTGGAGFIGSNFAKLLAESGDYRIVVVDKLTYAGNLANIEDLVKGPNFTFEQIDICDEVKVQELFKKYQPEWIANFAAETHVDRSIDGPKDFINTNFVGVYVLLEQARQYYAGLDNEAKKSFRFLQVSTDEVYGSLGAEGLFMETTSYDPNSPYSASKAGADHLVQAYYATYGLPCVITNCSNNYGPYQFPEKLIPLMILNALEGKNLPIYGDGSNVRDWLYVEDHCRGILLVLQKGRLGEKYNIGGRNERKNIEIVDRICDSLEKLRPAAGNEALKKAGVASYRDLKKFVEDRPGHDKRYAIDATKIESELGWKAKHDFDSGIERTIQWYLDNLDWTHEVQSGAYQRERLGLDKKG